MENIVKIKAINKDSWAGMNRFPKCKDTLAPTKRNGAYNTGLSDKEQKDLEKKLDLAAGELGPFSKFWRDFAVHITDKQLDLDLDNPMHYLTYKVLMGSERVAASDKDEDRVLKPKAEYAVFDEAESAKRENVRVTARRKAWKVFNSTSTEEQKSILKLMGINAHHSSQTIVENKLSELVDEKPEDVLEVYNQKDFKMKVFLTDCVRTKALRMKAGQYFFGDVHLGIDAETAIVFLNDPENQEILLALKAKVQATD